MGRRLRFDRLTSAYQAGGITGMATLILRRVRRRKRDSDWLRRKAEADAAFDAKRGTQTGGIQELRDLTTLGGNARYGIPHIASDPHHFVEMMTTFELDLGAYTFVDIGSGKGRAVLMAEDYPFRRLIGVEFALELHEAAAANVARLPDASRVELVHADATTYDFPKEPLVVYLFNPFSAMLVRRVAKRLMESWRMAPRSILVLYAQPEHEKEFLVAGWRMTESHAGLAKFVPPVD